MKKPASTVDETEDADLTTAVATTDESTEQPTPEVEAPETDAPDHAAEPEKGEPEKTPVADKAKADAPANKPDSPIQKAIDRLASDGPAKAGKPAAGTDPKDKGSEPSDAESTETEPKADKSVPGEVFADWTREERKHTKGSVKQRFAKLHEEVKTYREKFKDVDDDTVEIGRSWDALLEEHHLDEDVNSLTQEQVAWTIRSQAAVVRTMQAVASGKPPSAADLKVIDTVRQGLDLVDKHLGREAAKAPDIDLDKLEQLVKGAGESLDLEALASFVKEAKAKKTSAPPPPAPAAPKQSLPPTETGLTRPSANQPQADPERELYARRFRDEMVKAGAKPDQIIPWFNAHVLPGLGRILRREFPGTRPEVAYDKLSAHLKHQLHTEALDEWKREQQKKSAPPKPNQPTNGQPQRPLRTAGGGSTGNTAGLSPVQSAIKRLASDG